MESDTRASYYELAENTVTIPVGKTFSDRLSLMLKNLDGSGDVVELPIVETYLLPVTIRSASGGVAARPHSGASGRGL